MLSVFSKALNNQKTSREMTEKTNPPSSVEADGRATGTEAERSEQVRVRFEKLARIRERQENPYRNGLVPDSLAAELQKSFQERTKEDLEKEGRPCSVAGRIMAIRDFGKASFVRIKDRSG